MPVVPTIYNAICTSCTILIKIFSIQTSFAFQICWFCIYINCYSAPTAYSSSSYNSCVPSTTSTTWTSTRYKYIDKKTVIIVEQFILFRVNIYGLNMLNTKLILLFGLPSTSIFSPGPPSPLGPIRCVPRAAVYYVQKRTKNNQN